MTLKVCGCGKLVTTKNAENVRDWILNNIHMKMFECRECHSTLVWASKADTKIMLSRFNKHQAESLLKY